MPKVCIKRNKRKVARLLRDAREYMEGYGLDFSKLEPRVAWPESDHDVVANVIWKHVETGKEVKLTCIYWDEKSGAILQAGTSYGVLTL